jgi:hypothetical protein
MLLLLGLLLFFSSRGVDTGRQRRWGLWLWLESSQPSPSHTGLLLSGGALSVSTYGIRLHLPLFLSFFLPLSPPPQTHPRRSNSQISLLLLLFPRNKTQIPSLPFFLSLELAQPIPSKKPNTTHQSVELLPKGKRERERLSVCVFVFERWTKRMMRRSSPANF